MFKESSSIHNTTQKEETIRRNNHNIKTNEVWNCSNNQLKTIRKESTI
jgi:hypothetical protein